MKTFLFFAHHTYPFSMHVAEHVFLGLIIPALLVLAIPQRFAKTIPTPNPLATWLIGVGAMLAWHIPAVFSATLANEALHMAQQLGFPLTGMVFWWPIFHPLKSRRLAPFPSIAYLFTACSACSLLGAWLTFGPVRVDSKDDQQLAGLIMWVPCCFIYLSAILATAARWFAAPQEIQYES